MKKSLFALVLTFLALVVPAARADHSDKVKELISRVETCEAILQEFMGRPETRIPNEVLARAQAIVITNQLKAGAVLGIQDGFGVILVKRNGKWGLPILLKTGEASLGLQLGVNTVETIYIITDPETPKILFKSRMNIGVDAKAVAGPKFADASKTSKAIIDAQVLVYTKKAGFYAGATVKTGYLARDDEANKALYSTNFTFPELAYSGWVNPIPEVEPLRTMVQKIAP